MSSGPEDTSGKVVVGERKDWLAGFIQTEQLPEEYRADVLHHFEGVADWLAKRCGGHSPFLLGINGAQGSGKTTLARYLQQSLAQRDLRVALLSLDDFYLTKAERADLAREIHPLLEMRGVPGTHDTKELSQCIVALRRLAAEEKLCWPVFDKARDDRAAQTHGMVGPVDCILLEGWCVGTPAECAESLRRPVNSLESEQDPDCRWREYVNDQLGGSYAELFRNLDALCFLKVPGFTAIMRWRLEQEHKLKSSAGSGMADAEVRRFIQYYERVTRTALRELPQRADCLLEFDEHHRCVSSQLR